MDDKELLKEAITDWLIKYGMEWVTCWPPSTESHPLYQLYHRRAKFRHHYLERQEVDRNAHVQYRLTQEAIELIKENNNEHDDTGADSNQG